MPLTLEDRIAVTELISMHGHLVDDGRLDRLEELFTPDVVYDLTDFGRGPLVGPAAIREAALALGDGNAVAHHVTDVVVREGADGRVRARCKGLGVRADGTCGSVTYDDILVRTPDGWRISHRVLTARRVPLNGVHRSG